MAELGCSICAENFNSNATCVATKCGHVFHQACVSQWITNSRTCPSCRATCSTASLIRIFFTTCMADLSMRDLDSVTNKMIAAEERAAKLRTDNDALKEKLSRYDAKYKDLKNLVSTLDEKNKRQDHMIKFQATQLKDYNAQKARADSMSQKVKELSTKMAQMSKIEAIMTSSAQDAEAMVAQETCQKTMAFLVVNLKRELAAVEAKKNEMFSSNCCLNNKVKNQNQKIETLEDQFKSLESEFLTIQGQLRSRMKEAEGKRNSVNRLSLVSEEKPVVTTPVAAAAASSSTKPKATLAVEPVEQSDSPYLRLVSSSVGLTPLMKNWRVGLGENKAEQSIKCFDRLKPSAVKSTVPFAVLNRQKENAQAAKPIVEPLRVKNDRFKIENRLKSGVIKRPAPYNPK